MFGRKTKRIKSLLAVIQQMQWQFETAKDQLRDLGYSFAEEIDPEDRKRGQKRQQAKLFQNINDAHERRIAKLSQNATSLTQK